MPSMSVRDAKEIARHWSEHEARKIPGFVGTYLTGSTAWKDEAEIHPASSDIDVIVVIDAETLPEKLGKFANRSGLLEVGFVTLAEITEIDTILADYHLAGSFRKPTTICDPTGKITEIQTAAAAQYADAEFVLHRLKHARQNALSFQDGYASAVTLHDQVTSLFFAAGVTTHMLLTAALENPTIRRRYIAARAVLDRIDKHGLHEDLLATLGSRDLDAVAVQKHLDRLALQFDFAGSILTTPYRFAADMAPDARAVAIGGTQEMIDQGFHREAMFWLLAVYSRCRAVISVDAEAAMLARFDFGYWRMLNSVGITSHADMDRRADQVLKDIDHVMEVSSKIIDDRRR